MNTAQRASRFPRRRQAMQSLGLGALSVALALTTLPACSGEPSADPLRVSLDEGRQLFENKEALMFDIREADEHATGIADGARLLPMSTLSQRVGEIPNDPTQPVLLICNTQNRSSKVAQAMKQAGWTNVRYVHGGMSGWAQRGWKMVKPFGLAKS